MVPKPASKIDQSKRRFEEIERSNAEKTPISDAAMQLFEQMQTVDFAGGATKFMSMSPEEIGEAARRAAIRKTSR
jgi:hypothetical protein